MHTHTHLHTSMYGPALPPLYSTPALSLSHQIKSPNITVLWARAETLIYRAAQSTWRAGFARSHLGSCRYHLQLNQRGVNDVPSQASWPAPSDNTLVEHVLGGQREPRNKLLSHERHPAPAAICSNSMYAEPYIHTHALECLLTPGFVFLHWQCHDRGFLLRLWLCEGITFSVQTAPPTHRLWGFVKLFIDEPVENESIGIPIIVSVIFLRQAAAQSTKTWGFIDFPCHILGIIRFWAVTVEKKQVRRPCIFSHYFHKVRKLILGIHSRDAPEFKFLNKTENEETKAEGWKTKHRKK